MVKQYRKKPVVIKALQWTGNNIKEIKEFSGDNTECDSTPHGIRLMCRTLEGHLIVSAGDFIIEGVNGEFYPCKPDIFEKTYEEVK